MGRLHTCYAPVRQGHCCPLDLHVLGLPLAFILSQDQTLHPMLLFRPASLPGLVFLMSVRSVGAAWAAPFICCPKFQRTSGPTLSAHSLGQTHHLDSLSFSLPLEAGCKVKNLFSICKTFFKFFFRPRFPTPSFVVGVAKVRRFFQSANLFFIIFFSSPGSSLTPSFSEPGCKGRKFFRTSKNFFNFF